MQMSIPSSVVHKDIISDLSEVMISWLIYNCKPCRCNKREGSRT